MGEPDNTMVMVRRKVSSLAVALHGIKGHAVLLVLCGVLIAAVMPQSTALPGLWPGWLGCTVGGKVVGGFYTCNCI